MSKYIGELKSIRERQINRILVQYQLNVNNKLQEYAQKMTGKECHNIYDKNNEIINVISKGLVNSPSKNKHISCELRRTVTFDKEEKELDCSD